MTVNIIQVFEIGVNPCSSYSSGRSSVGSDAARAAAYNTREYGYNQKADLFADALIAATAEQRGEPIYTRDYTDMTRFYPNMRKY